jgi:F420H(2)-dependent quinone reductase
VVRVPKAGIRLLGRIHAIAYRISGGRIVGAVGPAGILLLTTTGRRTGRPRTAPLLFVREGDALVVVGSQGGHDTHPAWCLNLQTNPTAIVQVGRQRFSVDAAELEGEARERCWERLVAAYGGYAEYRNRTDRRFPIIALTPR